MFALIQSPTVFRRWLLLCLLLVALMVLIGGLTRLTESGLSIVKWKLVTGTLPPLTDSAWQSEFAEYQTSPQFQKVNFAFSLADFKRIYWLEYLHRLVGRMVGLAILLPWAAFTLHYVRLRAPGLWNLWFTSTIMLLLVAAQGLVGWIMVASGLVDAPRVAPLKLAMHLSLAFTLFCYILWNYWRLHHVPRLPVSASAYYAARALFGLIFLQIIFGALVAGLRAGLTYNTYPLMDGQLIPDGLWTLTPWWKNHLESVLTVQFQHRMLALMVAAGTCFYAIYYGRHAVVSIKKPLFILVAALLLQFVLGVATLLSGVSIPLAVLHQLGALLLLSACLRLLYGTTT